MDRDSRFLLKCIRKYYKEHSPILPERFTRREFGFMYFGRNMMQRHLAFANEAELWRFVASNVPAHCYYSTAYYRHPAAPTMEEKDWLGAELIFDLDADHLEGAENMTYPEMLREIRTEMIKLCDSYIFDDFGFNYEDVDITFSGGRGYHAHVTMPDVLTLGSHERREIVDYIMGSGLDIDWVFPYKHLATSTFKTNVGSRTNVTKFREIPSASSSGWRKRMRSGLVDVVDDFCDMDVKYIRSTYPSIRRSRPATIEDIQNDVRSSRKVLFERNSMATMDKKSQDMLVKIMDMDMRPRLSGDVDAPVTADIKRLIRLPHSVHGKGGLKVIPLSRDELTDFEPLEMAVPDEYSDDPVEITVRGKVDLKIKDERFVLKGETEVPEYAAVFLIGRRYATLGKESEQEKSLF
ncbi:MAG TPA: DNA primase catalytic subunit PriS [Candidatus Methanomethylophilaceae archaeon]|nr:DNA primase catalytic subunit PriS [Candidatus Methanomethylophilaceae archaeon]